MVKRRGPNILSILATTGNKDKPGLFLCYTYRCEHCRYVWLPQEVEIIIKDTLVNRPIPKYCARCKVRNWEKKSRIVSIKRIKALLREGKNEYAAVALAKANEKNKDDIIKRLELDGYPILELTTLETTIE